MTEDEKGNIERFPAPKGSRAEKFENAFDGWLDKNTDAIESGSDADFAKVRDGLVETALLYGRNQNQDVLSAMASEFDKRRSAWHARSESATMEEFKEANAAVSLRYADLAGVINRSLKP